MRKICFTCKRNLPLFFYHTDTSKYQRESAKGRVIECRRCAYKRIKEDKGVMQRIDNKFVFVPMGRIETIKYIFKK
jgi:hypothetical protein